MAKSFKSFKEQFNVSDVDIVILGVINKFADKEGWYIVESSGSSQPDSYQIQRNDEMSVFKSDEDVVKFVIQKANERSLIHIAALGFIYKYASDEEKDFMLKCGYGV